MDSCDPEDRLLGYRHSCAVEHDFINIKCGFEAEYDGFLGLGCKVAIVIGVSPYFLREWSKPASFFRDVDTGFDHLYWRVAWQGFMR